MAKKILAIALIAIVAVSAAACFVACEEEPTPYADLVAVRVNNFMAEWENIDYNFTYEGSSELKVSVPYTNYLRVDDLIVSPEAEYKVYEDEGKTKQLTDLSKIYVDGTKTLYIDVTNGELSNSYSVEVTVEQTNLPPESEIADKQYDNRGGHIYIPEGAETVMIDGVEYSVIWKLDDEIIDSDDNYILSRDCSSNRVTWLWDGSPMYYGGCFNGNNFEVSVENLPMFDNVKEEAKVINLTIKAKGHSMLDYSSQIRSLLVNNNDGTIENVFIPEGKLIELGDADGQYGETSDDEYFRHLTAGLVAVNRGTIKGCINRCSIYGLSWYHEGDYQVNSNVCFMASGLVYRNAGMMYNCVNTGDIKNYYEGREGGERDLLNGAGAIAYSSNENAEYKGVFNIGEIYCATGNNRAPAYDSIFAVLDSNDVPDMSATKNYR